MGTISLILLGPLHLEGVSDPEKTVWILTLSLRRHIKVFLSGQMDAGGSGEAELLAAKAWHVPRTLVMGQEVA